MADDGEALTVRRVAEVLGVSEQTVYRLIWAQTMPAFRVGRQLRVARVDLIAFRKRMRYAREDRP